MKKRRRIEIAREIIASVKKEMDKPRLAESVRNGLAGMAAQAGKVPYARSARA